MPKCCRQMKKALVAFDSFQLAECCLEYLHHLFDQLWSTVKLFREHDTRPWARWDFADWILSGCPCWSSLWALKLHCSSILGQIWITACYQSTLLPSTGRELHLWEAWSVGVVVFASFHGSGRQSQKGALFARSSWVCPCSPSNRDTKDYPSTLANWGSCIENEMSPHRNRVVAHSLPTTASLCPINWLRASQGRSAA